MKTRITIGFDATWLQNGHKSGVGYYTDYITKAMAEAYPQELTLVGHYYLAHGAKPIVSGLPNLTYTSTPARMLKFINLARRLGLEVPFELLLRRRVNFMFFPAYISHPSVFGTKSATAIHDLAFIDMPESVSDRNRRDLVRFVPKSIKRASLIATDSSWSKHRIAEQYKTKKPILATPLPPIRASEAVRTNVAERFQLTGSYILVFGTLEPRKNILNTVRAYASLPEDIRSTYSLVLAGGKGWNDAVITQYIDDLRSRGINIHTTGYVSDDEKEALYYGASVFMMCSFYEGFGMPLLEAMAHGVPVLASDITVFKEVCEASALYCDPHDPEDIATNLTKLLVDQALQDKLCKLGYKNLLRFSWPDNAKVLYDAILTALASTR